MAVEIGTGEVFLGADGPDGRTHWDGVRNFQAANNLKAMQQGDRAFFYHSNEGKEIVGVVKIVRTFYPDPADPGGKFGMVDVAPVMPVKQPVALAEMRASPNSPAWRCCASRACRYARSATPNGG